MWKWILSSNCKIYHLFRMLWQHLPHIFHRTRKYSIKKKSSLPMWHSSVCIFGILKRTHMRAFTCVSRRCQWPGQVCGWCLFSPVSYLETKTETIGFICRVLGRESFFLSPVATLFIHILGWFTLSFSSSQDSEYRDPDDDAESACRAFNETSNGIEYFSSYWPSITPRFDKCMRRVFVWINLCSDRSRVIPS